MPSPATKHDNRNLQILAVHRHHGPPAIHDRRQPGVVSAAFAARSGIRTPAPISNSRKAALKSDDKSLEEAMPAVYGQLTAVAERLETHYRDMQDIEFTVEQGVLYMLQTRGGKRTAQAALKLAVDMCREGLITKEEAIGRISSVDIERLFYPVIDPSTAGSAA